MKFSRVNIILLRKIIGQSVYMMFTTEKRYVLSKFDDLILLYIHDLLD